VGEDTFTYTAAGDDGDTNTTVGNIVTQFNQDLDDQGITGFRFEQADGGAAGSIVRVVNLDTTQGYDVSFSESGFSDTGTATQNAPTVDAATAASTSIDISGNVVEGDSFSVTLGSDTVTYVAGANESANDVIRGLQNVIAADGPAGVTTALNFAGDPSSGTASISLSAEAGFQVSVAEARGGTESTGDLYGLSGIDVTTADGAEKALGTIENLIQTNVDAQAEFGAAERRVELQQDFMSSLIDSFKSGIGSLVDTDMEEASARLQALQVQQQLGTQALSIANQAPQSILSLFR
jgi:flagellin